MTLAESCQQTTDNGQRNELTIEREDGCWVAPLYGLGLFGVRAEN